MKAVVIGIGLAALAPPAAALRMFGEVPGFILKAPER